MDLSHGKLRPPDLELWDNDDCAKVHAVSAGRKLLWLVLLSAGVLVPLGWILGIETLVRVLPHWPAIMPLTSLFFTVTAGGFLAWSSWRPPRITPMLALFCVGAAFLPGDLGVSSPLMRETDAVSPATRAGFIVTGAMTLLFCMTNKAGSMRWFAIPATAVLLATAMRLDGFVFDATDFGALHWMSALSVLTSANFLLLVLGLMLLHPRSHWMHVIFQPTPGGALIRRYVLPGVIGPSLLAWATLHASDLPFIDMGPRLHLAVMSLTGSALLVTALFHAGWRLDSEARVQAELQERLLRTGAHLDRLKARQMDALNLKFDSLGRVARGLAHDFNNTLAALQGNLELIDHVAESNPEMVSPMVRDALEAVRRGEKLVQRMRSAGGLSVLTPRNFNAAEALRAMHGRLNDLLPSSVLLHAPPPGAEGVVCLDRHAFEEVLIALVSNARDALVESGKTVLDVGQVILDVRDVTVSEATEGRDLASVRAEPLPAGRYVAVVVRDTGPGIPEERLSMVAEPFFTTKNKSIASGLGLATVDGFCRQSGGHMRIANAPTGGAMVTLYFPWQGSDQATANAAEPFEL